MADKAKQRVEALGKQLNPPSFEGMPGLKKVAGQSAAPRVTGKVVIVTGKTEHLLYSFPYENQLG